MTVLLISDVHARYEVINTQIRHAQQIGGHQISQVVVLGDFGFFADDMHQYFRRQKNRFLRPVACLDGNHEDYGALPDLAAQYADVVTYLPRGCVHEMGPWRGLCLGGTRYMDASSTPRGCEITTADIEACLAHDPAAVDVVLSHDCPTDIGLQSTSGCAHYGPPGVPQMRRLAERFSPRWWVFGHHHRWFDRVQNGTRYLGLPLSWSGYAVLQVDGEIAVVSHELAIGTRSWWRRWLGLG